VPTPQAASSRPSLGVCPIPPIVGFDLDMTLVDSAAGITATLAAALARVPGGDSATAGADELWPYIGLPLEQTVRALAPHTDPAQVARLYRSLYAEIGVPLTTLMPGARAALAAVRALGGVILVVSAKKQAGVEDVLRQVGLDTGDLAPDVVVGGLFAGAKGHRLRAERAGIYVGDHVGDVEAAKVASALSVAVATGPQSAAELAQAGADVVLPDLTSFAQWLSGAVSG
jgi:phosphoglycolate phosphatase